MTDEAFAGGLALLQDIYPKVLSEPTIALYRSLTDHMSDSVWLAAVKLVASRNTFFPVPAELISAAHEVAANASGIQSPEAAWSHVHAIARTWGEGKSVKDRFDGPTWQALQEIGGMRVVALAEDGAEIARIQRTFTKAYTRVFDQAADIAVTLPLPAGTSRALETGVRS